MSTLSPDGDATITNNLDALVASVTATIQYSLRMTKKLGGAERLNSPAGSDFFLGYVAGFADMLIQMAGGERRGSASLALVERSLVRLFGDAGAKGLYATIADALTGVHAPSPGFQEGLAAGGNDARQVVSDKQADSVGKSFIAHFVPQRD